MSAVEEFKAPDWLDILSMAPELSRIVEEDRLWAVLLAADPIELLRALDIFSLNLTLPEPSTSRGGGEKSFAYHKMPMVSHRIYNNGAATPSTSAATVSSSSTKSSSLRELCLSLLPEASYSPVVAKNSQHLKAHKSVKHKRTTNNPSSFRAC